MKASGEAGRPPLRVLQSFREPRPTTNPYITQLARALDAEPETQLVLFSFRTAVLGRYDVFHAHWPEIMVAGHSPFKAIARQLLTSIFLLRLLITGTPVVRTLHNIERPEGISRREHLLLTALDRLTTVWIRLNDVTEVPRGHAFATIPHGHYRDWFAGMPQSPARPGALAYVGRIRRYKGVEDLLLAFRGLDDAALRLHVAGMPSTVELERTVQDLAGGDERVDLELAYVDDSDLVRVVTGAELVVLPYRFMHNSGAALTALSLDRPVLVPDTEVNRRLAEEVGPGWVLTFEGRITSDTLTTALGRLRAAPPAAPADLSRRGWTTTAREHHAVYRHALERRRRGPARLSGLGGRARRGPGAL